MAAEYIETYKGFPIWGTNKGYFSRDPIDNTPLFYNTNFTVVQAHIDDLFHHHKNKTNNGKSSTHETAGR